MASVSEKSVSGSTTDTATPTYLNMAIGANGGSDVIYVLAGIRSTAGAQISGCTVDGVAASLIVARTWSETASITSSAAIFAVRRGALPDPAQTDVDVVVTASATCIRHAVALAVATGASHTASATASAQSGTTSLNLNTPANGIVVACAYNGDIPIHTWAGLTKVSDIDVASENSNRFSTAYASSVAAETPRTISVTTSSDLPPASRQRNRRGGDRVRLVYIPKRNPAGARRLSQIDTSSPAPHLL